MRKHPGNQVSRGALLLLVLAAGICSAEGELREADFGPGEVPVVDVEANVRKMLEESGSRQPASAPAVPPEVPRAGHRPAPSVPSQAEPEDYVPLPEETITVRSVGDVKVVERQLKEARERNAPAPPGTAVPAQ